MPRNTEFQRVIAAPSVKKPTNPLPSFCTKGDLWKEARMLIYRNMSAVNKDNEVLAAALHISCE